MRRSPLALTRAGLTGLLLALWLFHPTEVRGAQVEQPTDEGVVQGQVVDDGTGQPIPEAYVSVSGSDGETVATADADGRYELRGLAPGSYRVFARAGGYVEGEHGQRQPADPGRMVEV